MHFTSAEVGNISSSGLRIAGGLIAINASSGVTMTPNVGSGSPSPANVYSIVGIALGGRITLTTRTGTSGGGLVCIIIFPSGIYPNHVNATLTPANLLAAQLYGGNQVFIDSTSRPNQFWIMAHGAIGLTAFTTYSWYYTCNGW